MASERHRVLVGDREIGWVGYCTVSDIWSDMICPTVDDCTRSTPWRTCSAPPYVDGREPHPLTWVDVIEPWDDTPYRTLACLECRCIIPPPHDGYAYLDYPAEWVALAVDTPAP